MIRVHRGLVAGILLGIAVGCSPSQGPVQDPVTVAFFGDQGLSEIYDLVDQPARG